MTKILNKIAYPLDTLITDEDYVIGSDAETLGKTTKNYNIGALREFILSGLSPELGGTLKIREITYTGVFTSPEDVVNELVPDVQILSYDLFFVSVNGQKFLLKPQNILVGAGQTPLLDTDFIEFPISVGPSGEDGIDGENGTDGNGIASIVLHDTVGLVKTYRITFTDATTFDFDVTDGSGANTYLTDGTSTTVSGTGTVSDPFKVETKNLQKSIDTFPYTLVAADDKQTIFVDNLSANVSILVPNSLPDSFTCVFIQRGTGTVTITATGLTVLNYPTELTAVVKGRYYMALLEKDTDTTNFYLGGGLKLV